MSRVISVTNHKGGVGKTTIVANLGFSLARQFKVLLVDLDPQANLTSGLGLSGNENTLAKYFKEKIHFRSPQVTPYAINPYVHIIPGSAELLKLEYQLYEAVRSDSILGELLIPVKKSYDLILLDCPPSFNIFTINALSCSNLILAPAKPEIFSVHGIEFLKKFATTHEIPFKIVFNQINIQSLLHKRVMEQVTRDYNGNLLTNNIRNSIALAEAFESAQDIFNYRGNSSAADDFVNLADELIPYI